jgi:hypothetical protein
MQETLTRRGRHCMHAWRDVRRDLHGSKLVLRLVPRKQIWTESLYLGSDVVTGGMPTAFLSMVLMMVMMMMPSVELLQATALVGPLEMKRYVSCGCETAQGEQRT